jgi:hypothetical protein
MTTTETCEVCGSVVCEAGGGYSWDRLACYRLGYEHMLRERDEARAEGKMLTSEMSRGFRLLSEARTVLMKWGRMPTAEWCEEVRKFDEECERSRAIAAERWPMKRASIPKSETAALAVLKLPEGE